MATRTKHTERSHRSYRAKRANLQGFYSNSIRKAETDKYMKENKSLFSKFLTKFRSKKGDK